MSHIKSALNEAHRTLDHFLNNDENIQSIEAATRELVKTFERDGKAISCGNGGSMCDAIHFAEELTGRFRKDRKPLAAMALSDPGHLTCVANDFGFDQIFARSVEAFGQKGDILLAISTSGNSKNIINAVEVANKKGMKTIGLLGKGGGKLKDMVHIPIIIPSDIPDRIQEIHIKVIHIFIEGIERVLFPEHYI